MGARRQDRVRDVARSNQEHSLVGDLGLVRCGELSDDARDDVRIIQAINRLPAELRREGVRVGIVLREREDGRQERDGDERAADGEEAARESDSRAEH
jgi:hypothetical protein